MTEHYKPSEEEMNSAEYMMSGSQEQNSILREKFTEGVVMSLLEHCELFLEGGFNATSSSIENGNIIGTIKGHSVEISNYNDVYEGTIDRKPISATDAKEIFDKYFLVARLQDFDKRKKAEDQTDTAKAVRDILL